MQLAMAISAIVAFAVPAVAAANWTHEGGELESNTTITVSGSMETSIGGGVAGDTASVHAEIELTAGTTEAIVKTFTATHCTGFGAMANTTCTKTPEKQPWDTFYDPLTGKLTIKNAQINTHYYAVNKPHTTANSIATTTTTGNFPATPDFLGAMTSLSLSGEGVLVNGNPATVSGSLSVSPAGTYGIE